LGEPKGEQVGGVGRLALAAPKQLIAPLDSVRQVEPLPALSWIACWPAGMASAGTATCPQHTIDVPLPVRAQVE